MKNYIDYKTLDIAPYLPSLQSNYAQYAKRKDNDVTRTLPKPLSISDLDFLSGKSKLWNCDYTLYSSGQFETSQIVPHDMCAHRKKGTGIVVGDSGGFQLGTGKIRNKEEKAHLNKFRLNPQAQFDNWSSCGFRERTLRWLEKYTDYAMTLDMVLWAQHEFTKQPKYSHAKNSQLTNLSVQQLIDLSVDNLRYFADNRGKYGDETKFLSVLQDCGDGTGDAWYKAVKDFEFEGWALGSETKNTMASAIIWLRRLLDDGKLDKSEWVHCLGSSPVINQVVLTSAQRMLSKQLGHQLTISLDSSSPIQLAGKNKKMVELSNFTTNLKSWKMPSAKIKQTTAIARRIEEAPLPSYSPLAEYLDLADIVVNDDWYADNRTDTLSEHLLVNHNMYMYHLNGVRGCQLALDGIGEGEVPQELSDAIGAIEEYIVAEDKHAKEQVLRDTLGRLEKVAGKNTEKETVLTT